jgi:YVTN family beta-propeller protein
MTSRRPLLLVLVLAVTGGLLSVPAQAGPHRHRTLLLTTVTSANYISVADAATLGEIRQLGGHAIAPSVPEALPGGRKVYIENAGSSKGSISVLDTTTLQIAKQIEPSGGIGDRSARIQRDGRFYYYSSIGDGDVTQVDTRTDRVSRVFKGLGNVFTVSHDGRVLYVSSESAISAVDSRTGAVLGSVTMPGGDVPLVTGGVGWLLVTPDDTQLVKMSNPAVFVDIRNPRRMAVTTTVRVGANPTLGDVSPDGRQLWVPGSGDGSITVVDLRTHHVVKTIQTGRYMTALTFDPSGRHVYVAEDRPGGPGPNQADLVLLYVAQVAAGQLTADQEGQFTSRPVLDTPGRVVKYDVRTVTLSDAAPLLTATVPVQLIAFDTP